MNKMQNDFVTGQIIRTTRFIDQTRFESLNEGIEDFRDHVESFIEDSAKDRLELISIYNYLISNEESYASGTNIIEKGRDYVKVESGSHIFKFDLQDFKILIKTCICYRDDFLPLGSIVKLNDDAGKEIMVLIEQRMVRQVGKPFYIDYRGIPYPTGIFNEQMYVYFSIDSILEVVFKGYSDPQNEGFELALKENLIEEGIFSIDYQEFIEVEDETTEAVTEVEKLV
jgi:hypothetical protein